MSAAERSKAIDAITTLANALGHITAATEAVDEACVALHMSGPARRGTALRVEAALNAMQALREDVAAQVRDELTAFTRHPGA